MMYKEQEAAMVGYDGHVYDRSALRGQPNTLVINSLVSTSHTAADVTSDDNFFCVLISNVMISSVCCNRRRNWLFHGTPSIPNTGGTYTSLCIDSPAPSAGTKSFKC